MKYIFNRHEHPFLYQLIQLVAFLELENKPPAYQISSRGLLLSFYIEIFRQQTRYFTRDAALLEDAIEESAPDNLLVIGPALEYIQKNYMLSFTIRRLRPALPSRSNPFPSHFP